MKPGMFVTKMGSHGYSFNDSDMGFFVDVEKIVLILSWVSYVWFGNVDGWVPADDVHHGYVKAIYDGRLVMVSSWTLKPLEL